MPSTMSHNILQQQSTVVGEFLHYHAEPTPHLYISRVLPPDDFGRIVFPADMPETPKGRAGHDYYRGDAAWDAEMAKPGWADMGRLYLGEQFVRHVIARFAEDMRRQKCLVDPEKIYITDYVESWEDGFVDTLSETDDPNALFVRFDFQASKAQYRKKVHCDRPRRVVGGVFFIGNPAEQGMEGGEFGLFVDKHFQNDRIPHQPEVGKAFPFRPNEGVLFLNSNTGFHGPLPIFRLSGMRQWIYYAISSRRDIWPTD